MVRRWWSFARTSRASPVARPTAARTTPTPASLTAGRRSRSRSTPPPARTSTSVWSTGPRAAACAAGSRSRTEASMQTTMAGRGLGTSGDGGPPGWRRAVMGAGLALAGGLLALGCGRGTSSPTLSDPVLREFTLVAAPVRWEIQPGLVVDGWGYNGATPGPTLRATEGDRVRVTLTNRLPAPTTIHWHGIDVPVAQDGVPGLSQEPVEPGETFVYDFLATNPGTRWYHSHVDSTMQIQLGLFGAFIVDPRVPEPVTYDREFTYILTEKALDLTPAVAAGDADVQNRESGNGRGGLFAADLFLLNGKAGTAIDAVTVTEGERVRIRLINAGNLVHAMHTHGHSFKIIATDGNPVPVAAQLTKDVVLIGPAERYDVELVANNPGVWMFHCHINNHSANGMVTELGYTGAVPLATGNHRLTHAPPAP